MNIMIYCFLKSFIKAFFFISFFFVKKDKRSKPFLLANYVKLKNFYKNVRGNFTWEAVREKQNMSEPNCVQKVRLVKIDVI